MLNGQYTYIRATRNEGIGKESKKPFDIGKLVISDGLESVEIDIKPSLVPTIAHITKGDSINIEVEITNGFRGAKFEVVKVTQNQSK